MNEELKNYINEMFKPGKTVTLFLVVEHRITGKREEWKMLVPYVNSDSLMDIVFNFNKNVKDHKLKSIYHGDTGQLLYEPIFDDPETE